MKEKNAWIGGLLNLLILAVVLAVVQVSCQTTMPTPATAVATTHISVASTTAAPATPTITSPATVTPRPTLAPPTLTYTPISTAVVVLSTNESLAQGSHSYEREENPCAGSEARIETISFEFVSSDQLKLTTDTTLLVGYKGNYSRVSQDFWNQGPGMGFYITFRLEGFDLEHELNPGCKSFYRRLD